MTDEGLKSALSALVLALKGVGPFMVIGGIAVVAHGVPRHTDDIDAALSGVNLDLERLMERLAKRDLVPRIPEALSFARQNQILLLRHAPSGTEVDLSLCWLPFEEEALATATRMPLRGVSVPVARAEDLVIYKALAWRSRDQSDIARLLELHGADMDLQRVRRVVGQLAEAMEQPERAEELEILLRQANL